MKTETCELKLEFFNDEELTINGLFTKGSLGDVWTDDTEDDFEITRILWKDIDVTGLVFNIIGLCESKVRDRYKMDVGYALERMCIEQIQDREFDAEIDY